MAAGRASGGADVGGLDVADAFRFPKFSPTSASSPRARIAASCWCDCRHRAGWPWQRGWPEHFVLKLHRPGRLASFSSPTASCASGGRRPDPTRSTRRHTIPVRTPWRRRGRHGRRRSRRSSLLRLLDALQDHLRRQLRARKRVRKKVPDFRPSLAGFHSPGDRFSPPSTLHGCPRRANSPRLGGESFTWWRPTEKPLDSIPTRAEVPACQVGFLETAGLCDYLPTEVDPRLRAALAGIALTRMEVCNGVRINGEPDPIAPRVPR